MREMECAACETYVCVLRVNEAQPAGPVEVWEWGEACDDCWRLDRITRSMVRVPTRMTGTAGTLLLSSCQTTSWVDVRTALDVWTEPHQRRLGSLLLKGATLDQPHVPQNGVKTLIHTTVIINSYPNYHPIPTTCYSGSKHSKHHSHPPYPPQHPDDAARSAASTG